ncbi:hypothetical protein RvY_11778 [Ramazzottius varieornatus]|uniref:RRM domain-containing protein n=1 Tax=Ramazzottius varieornatus TaxID=947166 RepID=A0A1D1VJ91_RAMVA|nr:hypothetical protein RvY_11778 [Ramazzottius varieornatus]
MSSALVQQCTDLTDIIPLCEPSALYLKPIARVAVDVRLPKSLATNSVRPGYEGKAISNWEVMEKVKSLARPHVFSVMKVVSSSLEVIRYEGEVDNKDLMVKVVRLLEGCTIKLSGFSEGLKVSCAEAKLNFPQRHDWTAFFRDATNLNELKPGERPDTVILQNLPCKWFARTTIAEAYTKNQTKSTVNTTDNKKETDKTMPSATKLKEVFEAFGKLRAVDVPLLDPARNSSKPNVLVNSLLTLGHELVFDAYIQFTEYAGFVKCMTSLYGMKLLRKEGEDKSLTVNFKLDFDRTQHMSDKHLRKRRIDRAEWRRLQKEKELKEKHEAEEAEKRRVIEEQRKAEELRIQEQKRLEREERRRQRRAARERRAEERRKKAEDKQRQHEVAVEERKLLIAQRQLESIRLLTFVFDRLKEKRQAEVVEIERKRQEAEEQRRKEEERLREMHKEEEFRSMLSKKEDELRSVLMKCKKKEEKKIKKKTDKMIKRERRRERKALKLLRAEMPNPPLITPHMQRFLDDLPLPKTFDGDIPDLEDVDEDLVSSPEPEVRKEKPRTSRVASAKKSSVEVKRSSLPEASNQQSPIDRSPMMENSNHNGHVKRSPVTAPVDQERSVKRSPIIAPPNQRSAPVKRAPISAPSNNDVDSRNEFSFHTSFVPVFRSPVYRNQPEFVATRIEPVEVVCYEDEVQGHRNDTLLVVPSNHASNFDGKDPLFTSPKNVLYC